MKYSIERKKCVKLADLASVYPRTALLVPFSVIICEPLSSCRKMCGLRSRCMTQMRYEFVYGVSRGPLPLHHIRRSHIFIVYFMVFAKMARSIFVLNAETFFCHDDYNTITASLPFLLPPINNLLSMQSYTKATFHTALCTGRVLFCVNVCGT